MGRGIHGHVSTHISGGMHSSGRSSGSSGSSGAHSTAPMSSPLSSRLRQVGVATTGGAVGGVGGAGAYEAFHGSGSTAHTGEYVPSSRWGPSSPGAYSTHRTSPTAPATSQPDDDAPRGHPVIGALFGAVAGSCVGVGTHSLMRGSGSSSAAAVGAGLCLAAAFTVAGALAGGSLTR